MIRRLIQIACSLFVWFTAYAQSNSHLIEHEHPPLTLYQWVNDPLAESQRVNSANQRLQCAIENPEYMLHNWIELPTSPKPGHTKTHFLTLREAILLALRYNPNIQNAELDRIIQRYQLRLANNEFELQYALAGTALIQRNHYSDVGNSTQKTGLVTPEIDYKNPLGGSVSLNMDNNVAAEGNYNPLLNFNITQPLLRGFGRAANEANLKNAIDSEWLNKLNLQQTVMDQITQVITTYRSLIISGYNLKNQQRQLEEARQTFAANEKRIAAGQLEPTGNIQQSYQIESLSLMVEQAENDFRTTVQDLLQFIGLDPDMKIAVPSNVTIKKLHVPDVDESIQLALKNNTQYLALQMALKADERAYDVAKNEQLWKLDLTANVQAGLVNNVDNTNSAPNRIYNGRNVTESAGVTLTIPINDLSRHNTLIAAKVKLEKDRLNLIAAKRLLITSIKNTITTIESQAKRYELAKRQVKLAEESYALEKKKQAAGIASALDVHNTQNQLLQAQMGLINAKIAYLNQLSALQKMIGTTLQHWDIKLRYC